MEESLYGAAVNDDVATLSQLLRQDTKLLDKLNSLKSGYRTPLHIAAMLGHARFMEAILGYEASEYMILGRDEDGRNPCHLAAIQGRLEVLEVLIQPAGTVSRRVAAMLQKADRGCNILHLCAIYNQLEALKFLFSKLKLDSDFVNAKNDDGMTILHLSTYYHRDHQITKYLLREQSTKNGGLVKVNLKNADRKTAFHLLLSDYDQGIRSDFEKAQDHILLDWVNLSNIWYERNREALLIVGTILATMSFQIWLSPPGGVEVLENRTVTPIIARLYPDQYKQLVNYNTWSFILSLNIILMTVRGNNLGTATGLPLLLQLVGVLCVLTTAYTYVLSVSFLKPRPETQTINSTIVYHGSIVLPLVIFTTFFMTVYDYRFPYR
ncbi:OLC1v1019409C1 [Oldenlandia corymbosa var. corymbosa]|uniref:OLC1v1019409C1 n=1 Tax=Oldenlandia corymbosa var. corymbosa TaxID=529605 RepID=A0AAV1EEE5_OLDCO|nr:OLC1v1019409C1 [Oldenlandia corymbosa var. corymbosa]